MSDRKGTRREHENRDLERPAMNSCVGSASNPSPDVVVQVINRAAAPDFEQWWAKVSESGFCAVPVHLAGRNANHGAVEIMARCKNRRASVCPSCSQLYAGDTWQLVHGGIAGGDLPAAIDSHPMVFVTLTAPSFGPVHTAARDPGATSSRTCRPGDHDLHCTHGRPLACCASHDVADPAVGEPLCADCYDYIGHVLFTWYAPQLWHRFCVSLRRLVSRRMRELGEDPSTVRLAYVKVVEMQRRAIPHFHSVIRLDARGKPDEPRTPPNSTVDAGELAALVHRASARARLGVSGPGGSLLTVRFGTQIDTRVLFGVAPMGSGAPGQVAAGFAEVAGRRVAAYLAKYVTKSIADFGIGARRLHEAIIGELDVTDHVRRILYTIGALGKLPEHQGMDAWLHTLGYRGHITTKTRRYSTTMGALRARRELWRQQQGDVRGREPIKAGTSKDEPATAEWRYIGCGHANEGEHLLAISAAGRAREMRRTAREEVADEPGRSIRRHGSRLDTIDNDHD
jgi:hypothetical protein